ncbi:MAG: glycosyltransferase family A protein [archaeon]
MAKPIASIVVPAFNAEKTIGKCLESLSRQSFKGYETIVVDDGSRDKTGEIAESFRGTRVLTEKNAGPAVARNNGAKSAKGEIVVFTDSDCIAEPNWLEEMLKPFADKMVAGVQGRYKCRQKELVARLIQLEIEQRYEKMRRQKSIDFIGSYSAAYRKSIFEKLKGFDTSYPMASGEDTDFSFRVHEAGHQMIFNPNAIVYHTHPTSLWKYLKVKYYRAFWRTKVYKRHRGKMVKDSYTSQMVKVQAMLFYLLFPAAVAAIVWPGLAFLLGLNALLLFLTALPFAVWAFSKDKAVAIVSPFVILLRTAMFAFGLAAGIAREALGK